MAERTGLEPAEIFFENSKLLIKKGALFPSNPPKSPYWSADWSLRINLGSSPWPTLPKPPRKRQPQRRSAG
jgi:hypothetical protein